MIFLVYSELGVPDEILPTIAHRVASEASPSADLEIVPQIAPKVAVCISARLFLETLTE